jgi:predicted metal-binding membrane protein
MAAGTPPEPSPAATLHDRAALVTYAALLLVTAASWAHVVASMDADDMAGMGMVMAPTMADATAYVASWGVMMAAMMLPSAWPIIGLYAATQRRASRAAGTTAVALFVLGYLGLWTLTGLPVYLGSLALMAVSARALAYVVAAVLVVAGIFQITPLKQVCLRHCRSPLGFLLGHWRAGWSGSLAMGWGHAVYCLGCCWALMAVLVVAGAMGLPWVLLIACVVAAEKLLPRGERLARLTGVVLMLLGAAVAVHPNLAAALRAGGHAM